MKILSKENRVSVIGFAIIGVLYIIVSAVLVNSALTSVDELYYGVAEVTEDHLLDSLKFIGAAYAVTYIFGMIILFLDAKIRSKSMDIIHALMQVIFIVSAVYSIYVTMNAALIILVNSPDSYNSFYHVAIERLCVPTFINMVGLGIARYWKKSIGNIVLLLCTIGAVALYFTNGGLISPVILMGVSLLYSLCIKK